jgi:hypothetical protein
MGKKYIITLIEDEETGELILQFPYEVCEEVGFVEGTVIKWIDNGDGSYTIRKVEKDED